MLAERKCVGFGFVSAAALEVVLTCTLWGDGICFKGVGQQITQKNFSRTRHLRSL